MTQSNDLPARMSRAEDNIIDLRLAASALLQATDKNSADIAALIEVSRRNSEAISALQVSQLQTEEAIRDIRSSLVAITASIDRMDRLFDYLIRRDQGQTE